jgi:hypothetical protein
MWSSVLYHAILSIAIVFLGHFIWEYIQKEYVSTHRPSGDKQSQKYKEIISQLQSQSQPPPASTQPNLESGYEYISPEEKQNMMDELKSLLLSIP